MYSYTYIDVHVQIWKYVNIYTHKVAQTNGADRIIVTRIQIIIGLCTHGGTLLRHTWDMNLSAQHPKHWSLLFDIAWKDTQKAHFPHSYMRRDSFVRWTWLICRWNMTCSYMGHDSPHPNQSIVLKSWIVGEKAHYRVKRHTGPIFGKRRTGRICGKTPSIHGNQWVMFIIL